ncbi:redoxin domain-containing protein [uncultured Muribaculum sp.]|uniref:TlpA family protein disulfide reductase n=1 Tax=uncultured Muribaculum sp. TaxID=1918613 RepID=UPI0025D22EA5|nr:redoxin domain-containing protein [uncultured Muribaculum sp.]
MSVRLFYIFMLLLAMVMAGCVTEKDEPVVALGPGDAVPRFEVTLDDGTRFGYTDMQRTPCVITFFDTSCPDCRAALPVVQSVADRTVVQSRGVRFVCIARSEGEASIAPYWREASLTMPYSPQPDDRVYRLFANRIIPRIYLTVPAADESAPPVIAAAFVEHVTGDALLSAILQLP